jgi:CheY-like chemotaxis protein
MMLGIDGNMLLWWIRWSEYLSNLFVLVVMIVGMVVHKCLTTARDAGVNEFVAKPFSLDVVFKHI